MILYEQIKCMYINFSFIISIVMAFVVHKNQLIFICNHVVHSISDRINVLYDGCFFWIFRPISKLNNSYSFHLYNSF